MESHAQRREIIVVFWHELAGVDFTDCSPSTQHTESQSDGLVCTGVGVFRHAVRLIPGGNQRQWIVQHAPRLDLRNTGQIQTPAQAVPIMLWRSVYHRSRPRTDEF